MKSYLAPFTELLPFNKVLTLYNKIEMKRAIFILSMILGNIIFVSRVYSQKLTIEEKLTRIEQRIIALEVKLEEGLKATNQRIDDMNQRFYLLYILLAAIIGINGVMMSTIIKFTKEERPIGRREYEKILAREDMLEEEINKLKKEIQLRLRPTNPENS